MKKFFAFVVFLALAVILVPWFRSAGAEQVVNSVVFKIGVPYYVVNGQTPGVKMDVSPFIQNDRTFVPVRFLGNALGVSNDNIAWDDGNQTVTIKGNNTLQMTVGSDWMGVNGDKQAQAIDVSPVLMSEPAWRTFLPARYISEGLGYQVAWDDSTQVVVCWPAGQAQPDVSAAVSWLNGQKIEAVNGTFKINDYVIPVGTTLDIRQNDCRPNNPAQVEMSFFLDFTKENALNDAEAILSQSLDNQTVSEMISYARQKINKSQALPAKYWNSSNGKSSRVGSRWDETLINVTVWSVQR